MRERVGALINKIRNRTRRVPPKAIRKGAHEAVQAAPHGTRRATA